MTQAKYIDIRFYKTCVTLVKNHTGLTKKETDETLKIYSTLAASYFGDPINLIKSCLEMTHEEIQVLKEYSKFFATQIGLEIDEYKKQKV